MDPCLHAVLEPHQAEGRLALRIAGKEKALRQPRRRSVRCKHASTAREWVPMGRIRTRSRSSGGTDRITLSSADALDLSDGATAAARAQPVLQSRAHIVPVLAERIVDAGQPHHLAAGDQRGFVEVVIPRVDAVHHLQPLEVAGLRFHATSVNGSRRWRHSMAAYTLQRPQPAPNSNMQNRSLAEATAPSRAIH